MMPNENGSYMITEQGDLGLGLSKLNENETQAVTESKQQETEEDNKKGLY